MITFKSEIQNVTFAAFYLCSACLKKTLILIHRNYDLFSPYYICCVWTCCTNQLPLSTPRAEEKKYDRVTMVTAHHSAFAHPY